MASVPLMHILNTSSLEDHQIALKTELCDAFDIHFTVMYNIILLLQAYKIPTEHTFVLS